MKYNSVIRHLDEQISEIIC